MIVRLGARSGPRLFLGEEGSWPFEPYERATELTAYGLESENGDTDVLSANADQTWYLTGTAIQSQQWDSLWRWAWNHSGECVPFVLAPHGNAVAAHSQPHYVGNVFVGPKPNLGGQSTDRTFIFDFAWLIDGVPSLEDGGGVQV